MSVAAASDGWHPITLVIGMVTRPLPGRRTSSSIYSDISGMNLGPPGAEKAP